MLGAVIIAASRGEQTVLLGALGIDASLVATVAAGDHLDADASQFTKFADQTAHLEAGQAIAGGMGNDRLATRGQNPAQGFLQAGPVAADVTGFALD